MLSFKISHEGLDIQTAARILLAHALEGDLTPHVAVYQGRIEAGATVTVWTDDLSRVFALFEHMREAFSLGCAWLEAPGYSGCILKHPAWDLYRMAA